MPDSLNFFNALRPKILELITRETADCLRLSPYVVSVPPDPSTGLIGLTRVGENSTETEKKNCPPRDCGEEGTAGSELVAGGNQEPACDRAAARIPLRVGGVPLSPAAAFNSPVIYVKYHPSLSSAAAGTPVLLVYRGNLCNAYALPSF